MLSAVDQTCWLLTTLVEAFVVCLFFVQRQSSRFFFFNAYFLLLVTIGAGRYVVLARWGIASLEYVYFYFYTDAFLSVLLLLSIFEISSRLVGSKLFCKRNLLCSMGTLLATAWFSFEIVSGSAFRVTSRFAFELSQNLFIVCCIAVVLLWIWKLRNDPRDCIAGRFVNVLTIYFSLFLLGYGVRQLAPHDTGVMNSLWPMTGAWLPLGCGFALASQERLPRMIR